MLNRDISDSKGFAKLSPPAAVLFCMLIPNYSPHGKMNGDPGYLKGEICPRISYLTLKNIPAYLKEINEHTSVKWFAHEERMWIHSTNFLTEHQQINLDRVGPDLLPNYSGVGPDLLPPEVEVKGEVEVEVKVKEEGEVNSGSTPEGLLSAPADLPPLWNRICTSLPKCSRLTEKRTIHVKARLKERCLVTEWETIFQRIEASPFLTGQNDRDWKADFDWIIKSPDNAVKVLEGKYDGGKNGSGNKGVHGSSPQAGDTKSKPGKYDGIKTEVYKTDG
jgi:hypothetical protein